MVFRKKTGLCGTGAIISRSKRCLNVNRTLTAYFFGVFVEDCERIGNNIQDIEWGSTLVKNLLLIPTNPIIDVHDMDRKIRDVFEKVRRRGKN